MLHTGVLDDLGRSIAWGEVRPAAVLTIAGLEERYEVSRSVVREAVRVLESMRMVAPRRRVGLTVRPRSEWNALDVRLITWNLAGPARQRELGALMELRVAIEPVAARLAATRADDDERTRLATLAARLRELGSAGLGESPEYLAVDIAFHTLILRSSGNEMFAGTLGDVIGEVLAGRTRLGLSPSEPVVEALDLHEIAADAVLRRDGAAAEEAVRGIVREAHRSALAEAAPGDVPVLAGPDRGTGRA